MEEYQGDHIELNDFAEEVPTGVSWWFRRKRVLKISFSALYLGAFMGLVSIVRFVPNLLGLYLATAVLPVEVANFVVQWKKMANKQKPWWVFLAVTSLLLLIIATASVVDASKFVIKAAPAVASAAKVAVKVALTKAAVAGGALGSIAWFGPIIFSSVFFLMGCLSLTRLVSLAKEIHKARMNHILTPLQKVNLVSRVVKTAGLFALAGLFAPFMLLFAANPITGSIFLGCILAVTATLIIMKIVKTVAENRAWAKTIDEFKEKQINPYAILNIDEKHLKELINAKSTTFGLNKLKAIFFSDKNTERTPTNYIKQKYEAALQTAETDAEKLIIQQAYELIRKQRGRDAYLVAVKEAEWNKTINSLSVNPYAFLGTTEEEINKLAPGFFGRLFRRKDAAKDRLEALASNKKNGATVEEQQTIQSVCDMLKEKAGRELCLKRKREEHVKPESKRVRRTAAESTLERDNEQASLLAHDYSADTLEDGLMKRASGDPIDFSGEAATRNAREQSEYEQFLQSGVTGSPTLRRSSEEET